MTKVTVTCPQHRDETGDFEEFTRDLADVVDTDYSHLDANGLPMIGTFLAPGMLIVGKIGLRKAAIASEPLTELERSCLSDTDRAEYWRSRIYDGSLYASSQNFGRVVSAHLSGESGSLVAVVVLERPDEFDFRDM